MIMKIKKYTFLLAFIIMAGAIGCKKYDEGPALSLKSKKSRVANKWKIEKATDLEDGTDITADYAGEIWEFTKDGDYKENGNLKGTWVFSSDKEELIITKTGDNPKTFKILKLKEKEMWLEKLAEEELHLSPS